MKVKNRPVLFGQQYLQKRIENNIWFIYLLKITRKYFHNMKFFFLFFKSALAFEAVHTLDFTEIYQKIDFESDYGPTPD